MSAPAVLLVASSDASVADVRDPLTTEGFSIVGPDATESPILAAIVLADGIDDPVAFTRNLRHQLPPSAPILWLLTRSSVALAQAGLESGADACLIRPVHSSLLLAQFRATLRARTVSSDADEVRDLTLRLQNLYEQTEQDRGLAERLTALTHSPQTIPASEKWRFAAVGVDGVEVLLRGSGAPPSFVLHDVAGLGGMSRLASAWIGQSLANELRHRRPAAAVATINRRLREIAFPESAVVSASVAEFLDEGLHRVWLATAGFPAPVLVRLGAPAEVWLGSGPFLGSTDTTYQDTFAQLQPGEKLILLGRGAADLRPDVRALADRHRDLAAEELVEAIVSGLGIEGLSLVVAECRDS